MTGVDPLEDEFGRIREVVHRTVSGLTVDQLAVTLDEQANSIGWLVWHLARVQDDHLAGAAGLDQVWHSQGWEERFGLPFDSSATGWSQTAADVAELRGVSAELLTGYLDAVHEQTIGYLRELQDADFERIVDKNWDPPVTLGVRLVSVVSDCLQHAGQAAFVRGILERREDA